MSATAMGLRRALRVARRSPGRSLATGVLVFVPVLVASVALSAQIGQADLSADPTSRLGSADAGYDLGASTDSYESGASPDALYAGDVALVKAALAKGSRIFPVDSFTVARRDSAESVKSATVTAADWSGPAHDMLVVRSGRLPGPGEVVITPEVAADWGKQIGDRVHVSLPDTTLTVVGIGHIASDPNNTDLYVAPHSLPPPPSAELGPLNQMFSFTLLVDLPAGAIAPSVERSNGGAPIVPMTPDGFPPGDSTAIALALTVVALLWAAVVAGAAFALGPGARRRELGLLVSNGADGATIRGTAALEAAVVAVPAAALGCIAGLFVAPVWVAMQLPGYIALWDSRPALGWSLVVTLGVVAAAVLGSVFQSGPVLRAPASALLDEHSVPLRSKWRFWVLVGATVAVAAVAYALITIPRDKFAPAELVRPIVIGVVPLLLLAGLVRLGRAVLVVWGSSTRGSAVARVARRDLARRPNSAALAVMLVAIAAAGSLTSVADRIRLPELPVVSEDIAAAESASTIWISGTDSQELVGGSVVSTAGSPPARTAADLEAIGLDVQQVQMGSYSGSCAQCPPGYVPSVAVLQDPATLGLPPAVLSALEKGDAVSTLASGDFGGTTVIKVDVKGGTTPSFPADALIAASAASADSTRADYRATGTALAASTADLDGHQRRELLDYLRTHPVTALADDQRLDGGLISGGEGGVERGSIPMLALTAGLLLVLVLAAVAVHRREHRQALGVLDVVGAGPSAGRRLAAISAAVISGAGVAIGTAIALLVVVFNTVPWSLFWPYLLATLLVPAVVAGVAWLLPPPTARAFEAPNAAME